MALQSCSAVHLEEDNLGVVRHVGRLLDGRDGSIPFELVKDGDLLLLIGRMFRIGGLDTVRLTKFKGHADEGMVPPVLVLVRRQRLREEEGEGCSVHNLACRTRHRRHGELRQAVP